MSSWVFLLFVLTTILNRFLACSLYDGSFGSSRRLSSAGVSSLFSGCQLEFRSIKAGALLRNHSSERLTSALTSRAVELWTVLVSTFNTFFRRQAQERSLGDSQLRLLSDYNHIAIHVDGQCTAHLAHFDVPTSLL